MILHHCTDLKLAGVWQALVLNLQLGGPEAVMPQLVPLDRLGLTPNGGRSTVDRVSGRDLVADSSLGADGGRVALPVRGKLKGRRRLWCLWFAVLL